MHFSELNAKEVIGSSKRIEDSKNGLYKEDNNPLEGVGQFEREIVLF